MHPRLRRFVLASVFGAAVLTSPHHQAYAVVQQVDGNIVPRIVANIQPGLNKGENGSPYADIATPSSVAGAGPKGPLSPVFDADQAPQVYSVPRLANDEFGPVTFIDLIEGAGFESTFGWYNAGDDLSDLGNLHTVLSCDGINYEPTPATYSQTSVNFQTEYATGRYKGGFVGFFLITPESCINCGNCGRPTNSATVGRIYYTEKQANGDGNYVHYLVYQTKVTDGAGARLTDYYFGFEDLYRGGDNDFEDMLIFVRGLSLPCVPSAEICDGKDNNCDGLVDNSTVDTGGSCSLIAGNTPGIGECKAGVWACLSGGTKTCINEVGPSAERCDGTDNNCDGVEDNPANNAFVPSLPNACPPQNAPCTARTDCIQGAPSCVVQLQPQPERCNGVDDDCNGAVDDNPGNVGLPCTPTGVEPTIGECRSGTTVCGAGQLGCMGYVGPTQEVCDGKDNDCDGVSDEAPVTGLAPQCSPPGISVCTVGREECVNGVKVCSGFTLGIPETCDGADNDCNGVIDDSPLDIGGPCGSDVGACNPGTLQCVAQHAGNASTDTIQCVGSSAANQEVCDGVDNDCDGFIDEDPDGAGPQVLPGVGDACGDPAGCGAGVKRCKNGTLACITGGLGKSETCNGVDDDCDGLTDTPDPCPGESVCIAGKCSEPCAGGEFSQCPVGQVCMSGYCRLRDCTNLCEPGTVCDLATGVCLPVDGGAGTDTGSGGNGGADAGSDAVEDGALGGSGGAIEAGGASGAGNDSGDGAAQIGSEDGCGCEAVGKRHTPEAVALFLGLLAAAGLVRRNRSEVSR